MKLPNGDCTTDSKARGHHGKKVRLCNRWLRCNGFGRQITRIVIRRLHGPLRPQHMAVSRSTSPAALALCNYRLHSRTNSVYDPDTNIRQSEVAALVAHRQPLVINATETQHRCVKVMDVHVLPVFEIAVTEF